MKLNGKDTERTVHAQRDGDSMIVRERTRYFDKYGTGRHKWEESRVELRRDEIVKLCAAMEEVPNGIKTQLD